MITYENEPKRFGDIPKAGTLVVPDGYTTYAKETKTFRLLPKQSFSIETVGLVDGDGKKTLNVCGYTLRVNGHFVANFQPKSEYQFEGLGKATYFEKLPVDTIKFVLFQQLYLQDKLSKLVDEQEYNKTKDELEFYTNALTKGYQFPQTVTNLALFDKFQNLSKQTLKEQDRLNALVQKNQNPNLSRRIGLVGYVKNNIKVFVKTCIKDLKFCANATKTKFAAKKIEKKLEKEDNTFSL